MTKEKMIEQVEIASKLNTTKQVVKWVLDERSKLLIKDREK